MTDAQAVHHSLLSIDTHIDIPWPPAASIFQPGPRHVDYPKMVQGLRAACLVAYVPQGPRTAEGHAAAGARALAMLDAIRADARTEGAITARVTETADEIERAQQDGVLAVIPVVENGYAVGEDLGLLAEFRARGARYMTITHNGHNALADSAVPMPALGDAEHLHGGLSELGRAAIVEMNRLGMLVDISHVSKQTALQAAMLSKTPVLATHSCARTLCDVARNVDDQVIDAMRDCGGMVCITAVPYFVRKGGRYADTTVAHFADHVDYVVNRIGLAHCGIGSDFDGGGELQGWHDAGENAGLTAELMRRGYGPAQLAALWGGNFLRLLRQAEDHARA